jgi:hypothetical protein
MARVITKDNSVQSQLLNLRFELARLDEAIEALEGFKLTREQRLAQKTLLAELLRAA